MGVTGRFFPPTMTERTRPARNRSRKTRQPIVVESDRVPLSHMLAVMNDPDADPDRRDRMAIEAARRVHPLAKKVRSITRVR